MGESRRSQIAPTLDKAVSSTLIKRATVVLVVTVVSLIVAGPASSANQNVAPVASFTVSPTAPVTGELVTFTSTSTDVDGTIAYLGWDLDDDGSYDDGNAATATRKFTTAGTYTVRLIVVDDDYSWRVASKTVTVKANAAPTAGFSALPTDPETGATINLTSTSADPDGRALVEDWDLDNDGAFDDRTGHTAGASFADNGVRRISLRVTDSAGAVQTASRDITVRNRAPQAAFGMSASAVDTGTPVTFTSSSTDPDGSVASYKWDFNNDGATDATTATAGRTFTDNGTYTVKLTVTDDDGASSSTTQQVTVRNRAPSAAFGYGPVAPLTGDELTLTSAATDPDGTVAEQTWDLDGDGAYDDATGAVAHAAFATAGAHTVALRVRDDDGATSAPAFQSIDVASRPQPPVVTPPTVPPSGGGGSHGTSIPQAPTVKTTLGTPATSVLARLMSPFPRVRIHGVTTARGAKLDLLGVRTSGGNRVRVRCRGRGCPWQFWWRDVGIGSTRVRLVRVPGIADKPLRAGAVIEVFVTRKGAIGKYTRLKIRSGLKPPRRVDGCAAPGVARAERCPGR
jgi:PKD repeat protein